MNAPAALGFRAGALRLRGSWPAIVAAGYGCVLVAWVAGSTGGYLPTTTGWTAVVTLWLAVVALIVRNRVALGSLELAFVGATVGLTAWVGLSSLWSPSVTSTMHEVQRDAAYTGIVLAAVLVVQRASATPLLCGVLGGIVVESVYGLGTRLLPDRFGGFSSTAFDYRLSAPITYWNGLGIFATMGFLLALGFAVRARNIAARALAAATLPLLAATIYFTFSRGAWYALGLGLVVAVAFDPRRLGLIAASFAIAPWPLLAIVEVRRSHGLVTVGASLKEATHDGHRLIPALLVLAAVSAAAAISVGVVERRVRFPHSVRVAFVILLAAVLLAGVAGVWRTKGSPVVLAQRGWRAFHDAGVGSVNGNVGDRLLSLSADGRIPLWKVSLRVFEHAPIVGDGAGTFWESWAKYRTTPSDSTQAHSLYLGAMGELGIVGLLVILVLILAPVSAAFRARANGMAPLTLGAFVAWAAHAGIDWDWALLGVTAPALLSGVALLKSAPRQEVHVGRVARLAWIGGIGILLAVVIPVLVADLRIRVAEREATSNPQDALSEARSVHALVPWSSQPYQVMADAFEREGKRSLARDALRQAISKDSSSWILWQLLANASTGRARAEAEAHARELNPLELSV